MIGNDDQVVDVIPLPESFRAKCRHFHDDHSCAVPGRSSKNTSAAPLTSYTPKSRLPHGFANPRAQILR